MDSGGERTAYTPISNFVYDVNYQIYSYVTQEQIDVYTKKDLTIHNNWWTGIGDTIYILGEYGSALQICYPIDAAYGGGYKLGWIPNSSIKIEQEKILENITINTYPVKTEYLVGETIDLTGLEIMLTYSDSSTEIITTGFTVSGFSSNTTGEKNVTVTYEEKSANFSVNVKEESVALPQYNMTVATGRAGETVEVYVSITNNPGIISLRYSIAYDTNALELVGVEDCGMLNGYTTPSQTINSPYILRWADSFATENNISNGDVVKLSFKIKEIADVGAYDISVSHIESRNINGTKINFEKTSSSINVIDYILGDIDDDGEISDWDSILLNRYLAGWNVDINENACDVDEDGEISDWDAIVLERYLAGWSIELGN